MSPYALQQLSLVTLLYWVLCCRRTRPLWFARYGSEAASSYFELVDEVVTIARLDVPTLPAYIMAMLDIQYFA